MPGFKQTPRAAAREIRGLARLKIRAKRTSVMPNYDYECPKCGKRFEVFQSMNDPKLTDCPESNCDGAVKRLLGTGGGIIFKGAGFYQTDYRSSSYQAAAKAESAPAAAKSDGGGGCGKSDCCAKPAAAAAN
jgi:putative FmdB family regulatory protein